MDGPLDRLGVVVLNWNGREHLDPCLRSLAESDHPDFFTVVVDNASADGSVAWLRERHPGVEVLALTENRRFAGGNNAGAARALELGAAAVLLLNNDATVRPDTLRAMGDVLRRHPRVAVVGPRIVYLDRPDTIWFGGGRFGARSGWSSHRALRAAADAGADPEGDTDWVTGCALLARAEVWSQLGGLDESFYIYAEDADFCLRAAAAGGRIYYCPRAEVRHAVSASVGGSDSRFKAYHKVRARWQLMRRHGVGPFWPVGLALRDAAEALRLLSRGAPRAAVAALRASWQRGTGTVLVGTQELVVDSLHPSPGDRMMERPSEESSVHETGKPHEPR